MDRKLILFVNAADNANHKSSANASIYPNLGLLTLMSSLKSRVNPRHVQLGYIDGTVYGNEAISKFIAENGKSVFAVCFSALSANYGESIKLAENVKKANTKSIVIFGNDHFSAMYREVMTKRRFIDYGFFGNDTVGGFCDFVCDLLADDLREDREYYAGLVYRDENGVVIKNEEDPSEYFSLPMVDYALTETLWPHQSQYLDGQRKTYLFMRDENLRGGIIDIGRGCVKFAGRREKGIPVHACDFCAILPGSRPIISQDADRAWSIIKNACDYGYNYLYVTADELPLTLWPMLREMAEAWPSWYKAMSSYERPQMFGYARAEAFLTRPERIDALINGLGFNHFFIGFDGFSETSLRVMGKQPTSNLASSLMEHNLEALNQVAKRRCKVTAGGVLTHLGITPEIMSENFKNIVACVSNHPQVFAALDFGALCPIPGSRTYLYLQRPAYAESRAKEFGLRVNREYLDQISGKYIDNDLIDMNGAVEDFVKGCCPDIDCDLVHEYHAKIEALARTYGIVMGGAV